MKITITIESISEAAELDAMLIQTSIVSGLGTDILKSKTRVGHVVL